MNIRVNRLIHKQNRVDVDFSVGEGLREFFTGEPFFYEYNEDISDAPNAIAVIPFVTNVLPIIWLFNADLYLPELDKSFYECVEKVKLGYISMYPEADFSGGRLHVDSIIDCSYKPSGKCTAFFSGGLDAVHTLIRHADEKPDLITIWGSDLHLYDIDGWNRVKKTVERFGNDFGLKNVYIKSSFASFIEERKLSYKFLDVIHSFWYHNIQHGIGMLGLVAPYAYKYKIKIHYIGSSYSGKRKVECASDPSIDNELRFASCQIIHDAYGYTRQDKIREVMAYGKEVGRSIPLRVCWTIKDGTNCCRCEKCYRTIIGIIIEGDDPQRCSFDINESQLNEMKQYMTICYQCDGVTIDLWRDIQDRFYENKKELKKSSPYYKYIKWLNGFDFNNIKNNKPYKDYQRKTKLLAIGSKMLPRKIKDSLKKFIHIGDD